MNRFDIHIASLPLLPLLILIGLGFAQMHDVIHAAESVQAHSEIPYDQLPDGHENDDCLACTLTFFALSDTSLSVSPDYPSKEKLTLLPYTFTNSSATKHIRLRAPPV